MFDTAPVSTSIDRFSTLGDLLAGIAAADDRCHDAALRPVLEAALGERGTAERGVGVVMLVRELVWRAAADPGILARRLPVTDPAAPGDALLSRAATAPRRPARRQSGAAVSARTRRTPSRESGARPTS